MRIHERKMQVTSHDRLKLWDSDLHVVYNTKAGVLKVNKTYMCEDTTSIKNMKFSVKNEIHYILKCR